MQQTNQNSKKPEHNIEKEGRNKKYERNSTTLVILVVALFFRLCSFVKMIRLPFGAIGINRKPLSEASTPNLKVCLSSSKEELKIERDKYYDERKRKG